MNTTELYKIVAGLDERLVERADNALVPAAAHTESTPAATRTETAPTARRNVVRSINTKRLTLAAAIAVAFVFTLAASLVATALSRTGGTLGVRVYYASSGGSSVSINVNGIDQVPRTNEWIDSEAEMHKQIDVLGKTVEGDYKKTYQNDTRTARDEYEGTEKDKNLNFTVDRKTGKVLIYHNDFNAKYVWPDDLPGSVLTEEGCLDVANCYLEQLTDLSSEYTLTQTSIVDHHLSDRPVSYRFKYELSDDFLWNDIYIIIRSDGELTDFIQHNYIDKKTYDHLRKADLKKVYNITDKAIKKKLGAKYDDYYIDRQKYLPYLAIASDGGYQIAVAYVISVNADDPISNQLIVVVPLNRCLSE